MRPLSDCDILTAELLARIRGQSEIIRDLLVQNEELRRRLSRRGQGGDGTESGTEV
jgi:hypothetical protein